MTFDGRIGMTAIRSFLALLLSVLLSFSDSRASTLKELENEFIGMWVVTVAGDPRTRTLKIHGLVEKSGGVFVLENEYGWSDSGKGPIKAEIVQSGRERKLAYTTQAGSRVVATQGPDGKFSGTFTLSRTGEERAVTIRKIGADELASISQAEANAVPNIATASDEVPPSCAALLGGWSGKTEALGRLWLWVVAVDSKCMATYSYGVSPRVPRVFKKGEIKDGVLATPLQKGIVYFERAGDDLLRRYSGPDGENSSAFRKVHGLNESVAILRVKQQVDLQSDLGGPWVIRVEGESRTRTLRVQHIEQQWDHFTMESYYGWTSDKLTYVLAEMRHAGEERSLSIKPTDGSKISVIQNADGTFSGTFEPAIGFTRKVTIARFPEYKPQ